MSQPLSARATSLPLGEGRVGYGAPAPSTASIRRAPSRNPLRGLTPPRSGFAGVDPPEGRKMGARRSPRGQRPQEAESSFKRSSISKA